MPVDDRSGADDQAGNADREARVFGAGTLEPVGDSAHGKVTAARHEAGRQISWMVEEFQKFAKVFANVQCVLVGLTPVAGSALRFAGPQAIKQCNDQAG